jgi:hypothetical protein
MVRTPGDRLIRLREVADWTGMSKSEVYRRIADGRFPRSVGHLEIPPQIGCSVIPLAVRVGGVGHGAAGLL